jgi:hypothetical protein
MRCGCPASVESQRGPTWDGILRDLYHLNNSSCQLARYGKRVWDSERVIHVDFLQHGATINAWCYNNVLHNDAHKVVHNIKTLKSVKDHPTARQCSPTCGTFHEGDTGNHGTGNHEPTSLWP